MRLIKNSSYETVTEDRMVSELQFNIIQVTILYSFWGFLSVICTSETNLFSLLYDITNVLTGVNAQF